MRAPSPTTSASRQKNGTAMFLAGLPPELREKAIEQCSKVAATGGVLGDAKKLNQEMTADSTRLEPRGSHDKGCAGEGGGAAGASPRGGACPHSAPEGPAPPHEAPVHKGAARDVGSAHEQAAAPQMLSSSGRALKRSTRLDS
mmetsp:Transcript_32679/g.80212  ORF Transcript_32679/g.80212 Transcript_32679/m.80212 type:complete len:143 (+) Transcript_32679:1249-1677(+)